MNATLLFLARLTVALLVANVAAAQSDLPQAAGRPDPNPDPIRGRLALTPAPNLAAATTFDQVKAFVDWASASTLQQSDEARRAIASAAGSAVVNRILCDNVNTAAGSDHSRTLILLSILGEMRSQAGGACLSRFLQRPFPQTGTLVDGEIAEQTSLGMLQAKAVDGLAYQHTPEADRSVLDSAARHPSRIVRAEAIDAYLWNHGDSVEARTTLFRVVQPEERLFIARPRRTAEQTASDFNKQLDVYLRAHPEAVPPAPERPRVAEDAKQESPSRSNTNTRPLTP